LGRSSSTEPLRGFADNGLGHGRIVGCLIGMKVFLRGDMRMTSCLISSCVVRSDTFVQSLGLGRVRIKVDRKSSGVQYMGRGDMCTNR